MKKILLITTIIAASVLVSGCGFNCGGYSCGATCSSCNISTSGCCGSSGWY